jgi:hypothetical protein
MNNNIIECINCHKKIIYPSYVRIRMSKDKFTCSSINWNPSLSNFASKNDIKELCIIDAGFLSIPVEYQLFIYCE